MKSHYIFSLLISTLFILKSSLLFSQSIDSSKSFKVIGYYSVNQAMELDTATVRFDVLTHINLFFVNPDSLGNFHQNFKKLHPFVVAAHQRGIKILISIGGGAYPKQYHSLITADKRPQLINKLVDIVVKTNLDGIDVDLEHGYVRGESFDTNYSPFVIELAKQLKKHNKLITVALGGEYPGEGVSEEALAQFDLINIMSYDHKGPWDPNDKGQHARFYRSIEDLLPYMTAYNIPREKLILGLPFYGYAFGSGMNDPVITMGYNEIANQFPAGINKDNFLLSNGYTMYHNGIQTIKNKTKLAQVMAGGVMIWQLSFDSTTKNQSLLEAIREATIAPDTY